MFKKLSVLLISFLILLVSAEVVEYDDKKLEEALGGEQVMLVEFYAPWCKHCKELAPIYQQIDESFQHIKEKIIVSRIDADKYKSYSKNFNIKGYPTIKLFLSGSKEALTYSGQNTLEDILKFIEDKSGLIGKPKPVISKVVDLDESNFDEIVGNPENHVMVEFYAPWCGHCKKLAPTYEKVAQIFENDKNVIIARVDAIANDKLNTRYRIGGYPTVLFFEAHKRDQNPESFERGRDEMSFISYLNEKCNTHRLISGNLDNQAGRYPEFDKMVKKYILTDHPVEKQDLLNFARRMAAEKKDRSSKFYYLMMQKVDKDRSIVAKEIERINKILAKGKLGSKYQDDFKMRLNILEVFKGSIKEAEDIEKEARADL